MNSLVLLIMVVVVFAFGYRFYSKLLKLGVFRLGEDYSTPSPDRPAEAESGVFGRHLLFGHHVASLAAGAAITGGITSLIWGWVPAFLWAVVGTVVAAGTYGLGALWLSLHYPGRNPAEIAARLLGAPAHGLFALVAFLLLLIMNSVCATLAAQLLSAFPASVLPFWIVTALALPLGNFLRGREDFEIIPASLIALALSLMVVWLLGDYPLSFTGALHLETAESYFPFDATVVWVMLLFSYGYYVTRLPMWKLMRPRGYLTALLLGTSLLIFFTVVMIDQPSLVAPEFHSGPGIPDTLPWLFVTLTSGAVAGFHLLVANAVTVRQMKREADARYIGYGGALALGLLALSAIIIGSTGLPNVQDWNQRYTSWETFMDLHAVPELYINGFARHAAGLGLDMEFARSLMAVVVIGLLVATLEAGLRAQKQLLSGLTERYPAFIPGNEKALIATAVGLSALLALHDGHGRGGLALWPLFGVTDQFLAILGFALLAVALRHLERPVAAVIVPLVFLLVAANWGLGVLMMQWWSDNRWILLLLAILLITTELGVTFLTLNALKSPRPPQT
ncbi:MAG: carbon starvation CstA family protein [Sulfuricaulis sp.]|uniref:carbon starvation CstA family protein n=1 Tax=Sulfuricaulis sp. TaxID=2003553 RepID=UPI003C583C20